MTTVQAQVVRTKRGPMVRVTHLGHLIGYYPTVEALRADIDATVEIIDSVGDYSAVVPPVYARAHHYEDGS